MLQQRVEASTATVASQCFLQKSVDGLQFGLLSAGNEDLPALR